SLGERLKKAPIPPAEMFDYGAQAALGLAHAHDQGIVHRDIKPSNMLLTEDRKIKILDLGLGVLMEADNNATFATADGIAVGTVDYMSPEQALGREVDGRSDVFSLGCAMFHLMTGKLAFPGDSPIDRLGRRISAKPVPLSDYLPDVPPIATRVLEKMMALKPQDRFASAREAAEALQGVLRPKSRSSTAVRLPVATPEVEARLTTSKSGATAAVAADPVRLPIVISEKQPAPDSPTLPKWFAPLANAAGRRPRALLLGLIATLALIFGAGVGVGFLLKP
ncbi:MAG: serine/threonine-protein kinase, partial [Isosphaeraceae bacterium]